MRFRLELNCDAIDMNELVIIRKTQKLWSSSAVRKCVCLEVKLFIGNCKWW